MTGDFKSLLRSNLLAFAMKAHKEMNAQSMPDDPYLQLLADRLAARSASRRGSWGAIPRRKF
jgi:hypothetical protein